MQLILPLLVLLAATLASAETPAGEPVPPPTKTRIILHGLTFDPHGGTVAPEAIPLLDAAVNILEPPPSRVVIVAKRSDRLEPNRLDRLQLRHAKSVRDYLVGRGITTLHVRLQDLGVGVATSPASTNDTAERPGVELCID